ncbi:hypothetical protein [Novosphingobium gossypii]|uniref:hypothetical protein n=1 Tax=Novosphingobium gossypii TaxID=1604774 RepID=UPI003D215C55
MKIDLLVNPPAVFSSIYDPNSTRRAALKSRIEDDRIFHFGNLFDAWPALDGRYQAGRSPPGERQNNCD